MRQRFTINEQGMLVDRHGYELGRIVGLTLDRKEPIAEGDIGGLVKRDSVVDVDLDVKNVKDLTPYPLDEPAQVWAHYVEVMKPRRKEIDPEARRIILDALKVATVEECNGAIDGCRSSAFHMGDNPSSRKHNALSKILKGKRPNPQLPNGRTVRDSIDMFLEIADKNRAGATSASVDPDRLVEAKLNVLTAHDYPGNELARKNGEMSAHWLARHGYRVDRDPATGRPTFHLESES